MGRLTNKRIDNWVRDNASLIQVAAVGLASAPWLLVVFLGPMWLFGLPAFLIPAAAAFRWTTNPDPEKEKPSADIG